ncbi:MAG TPA: hypothetical protein VF633_06865 [Brevundimonas sp.]
MKKCYALLLGLVTVTLLQSCSSAPRYAMRNLSSASIAIFVPGKEGDRNSTYAMAGANSVSTPFALPVVPGTWAIRAGRCVHIYPTPQWQNPGDTERSLTVEERRILENWQRNLGTILNLSFSQDGKVRAYANDSGAEAGHEIEAAGFPMTPTSRCS